MKKKSHLIFVRTKGGIAENFGRIQRGDLKFAWKMNSWGGGGDRESQQKLLG